MFIFLPELQVTSGSVNQSFLKIQRVYQALCHCNQESGIKGKTPNLTLI